MRQPKVPDKYFVSKFCIQIFSEQPIPDDMKLMDIIHEAHCGDYAASVWCQDMNQTHSGLQMAMVLTLSGSDPGFFSLDKNGDKIKL